MPDAFGSIKTIVRMVSRKNHGLHQLVYLEVHDTMEEAVVREKRLKKWNREWKIRLIQSVNPEWRDLYDEILR